MMSARQVRRLASAKSALLLLLPGKLALAAASTLAVTAMVVLRPPALSESRTVPFQVDAVTVTALAPETSAALEVSVTNPNDVALAIIRLTAVVAAVHAAGACGAENFTLHQFSGAYGFVIAGHSTARLAQLGIRSAQWPQITMVNRDVNQDGCRDAVVTIRFAGEASKAS
jgi:hypothetical protein